MENKIRLRISTFQERNISVCFRRTFVVAVLSVGALGAFKATSRHTVYDALPGAGFTVLAAVGEWHLTGWKQTKVGYESEQNWSSFYKFKCSHFVTSVFYHGE